MSIQTRSMTKKNINADNSIQDKSSTDLFVYKDNTTGIEYIMEEQIQMRKISNNFKTLDNIMVGGLDFYDKITEINPRYLKSIPKYVADRKDLFALAPEGYLWKEDDRGTSYFRWDEWKSLKNYNYKRGSEFNLLLE